MTSTPRPFLLLASLFFTLVSVVSAASQNVLRARPNGVAAYHVTWDVSYNEELSDPSSQGFTSFTYRGSNTGSADFALVGSGVEGTLYQGSGKCSGEAYIRQTIHTEQGDFFQDNDGTGTDVDSTSDGLLVLYRDGTYQFSPPVPVFSGFGHDFVGNTVPTMNSPQPAVVVKEPQGRDPVITFDGAILNQVLPTQSLSVHLRATMAPAGPPPKLVLAQTALVTPEVGATIAGVVKQAGAGGSPVPIRFILEEVTREPGQCLNGPDTGAEPDLDFSVPANLGRFKPPVATGTGWTLETLLPATSATCQIGVRDFGAWGKLRAEAFYQGSWHAATVEKSKLPYTTVPLDLNLNKIADKWEKDNRLKNPTGAGDLEKTPKGDGSTIGDGFSNYEEYRGLFARGKHVRLNPNVKELVIETGMGSEADQGLALFQGASGFTVIRLDPGELPGSRVANANHGQFHGGDQHGLRLVSEPIGGGAVGEAVPLNVFHKHPKDCTLVRVDPAPIQASPPPGGFAAEFAATIAHELAHAIGVEHHGDPVEVTANRDPTGNDSAHYHLFGSDGAPLPLQHLSGALGGPHSEASGDVNCVMCYTSHYQWCVIPPTGPDFNIYAAHAPVTGTRFCTSATGTGMNAGGKYFGNATRGNCLSQMRVKDY